MQILNENGKTYLKGFMTEAEVRNGNGRLYPTDVCKPAVLELKERVQKDGVLTYLDHPNHSDLIYEDSCGKIIEVDWIEESKRATCKVEILDDTKDGKAVLERIKKSEQFGISTRGTGSLDENKIVQPGLKFITADIIGNLGQSCQVCSMDLHESNRINTMDDMLLEVNESCDCMYNSLSKDDKVLAENYLLEGIKRLIEQKYIYDVFTKKLDGKLIKLDSLNDDEYPNILNTDKRFSVNKLSNLIIKRSDGKEIHYDAVGDKWVINKKISK